MLVPYFSPSFVLHLAMKYPRTALGVAVAGVLGWLLY